MATTATSLIAYRNELRDGGIATELADDLVRDAARIDVADRGLRVSHPRATEDTTPRDTEGAPSPQG